MKNNALLFIILYIIWAILTWSLNAPELLLGLIVCLMTVYVTVKLFGDSDAAPSNFLKLSWLVVYCAFLIWDVFKASFAVLLSMLKPSAPGKTIFFEARISVRNSAAIGLLMNALTLLPDMAVVTANVKNGSIGLHLMSVKADNYSGIIDLAIKKYEGVLKKVFE